MQGNSPYQYSHTAMYKAHVTVAVLCLLTLTAILGNLLWRVGIVVKQKKSWWVRHSVVLTQQTVFD